MGRKKLLGNYVFFETRIRKIFALFLQENPTFYLFFSILEFMISRALVSSWGFI